MDIDKHITTFLTLTDIEILKSVNKEYWKTAHKELQNRSFPHWDVLKSFNEYSIPDVDLKKIEPLLNKILFNQEFWSFVFIQPITTYSIVNVIRLIPLSTKNMKLRLNTILLSGKVIYLHYKKNKPYQESVLKFIKSVINSYIDIINDEVSHSHTYKQMFKKYIVKFIELL